MTEARWAFECPECKKSMELSALAITLSGKARCPRCHKAVYVPLNDIKGAVTELVRQEVVRRTLAERTQQRIEAIHTSASSKLLRRVRRLEARQRIVVLSQLELGDLRIVREDLEAGCFDEALQRIELSPITEEEEFNATMRRRRSVEYLQFREQLDRMEGKLKLLTQGDGRKEDTTCNPSLPKAVPSVEETSCSAQGRTDNSTAVVITRSAEELVT